VSESKRRFQLSTGIDRWLATLAKLYEHEGERQKLEIVVNSEVRVVEEYSYDNWEGGTYGHALYFSVPENLYLKSVRKRNDLEKAIKDDLNKLHNIQNEFIDQVFLEMEKVGDRDWRRESGVLQSGQRAITRTTAERIWGTEGYRVFLSHKAEVKKKAGELKEQMAVFGVSGFVAHADIKPTKEWQDEIENALASMDAFVALLTEKFHKSFWTDQEVGYALGRGVPLIAVKLGSDPYGFIGKFQALACTWEDAPLEIVKLLIKHPRMLDAYIKAVPKSTSFDEGNTLSKVFANIETVTDEQAEKLASAFNKNTQLQGSYGFNGDKSYSFGDGLAAHLSRMTGTEYVKTASGEIRKRKK
jgi:TIR domain-containing protein